MTKIQWTDETFNGWCGCTKVSPGCANCYAETLAKRNLSKSETPLEWGRNKPRVRNSASYWEKPIKWNQQAHKKGIRKKVFASSMADIFDSEVDPAWRADFLTLVSKCPYLDWQVLTKRPQNILEMLPENWGQGWDNVWLGTSVEDQIRADERIPLLTAVPAKIRFLSVEPLLGPVQLNLDSIDWVICGGESGPKFRPMEAAWAQSVRDQCISSGTPFFFKQWGTCKPKEAGNLLDGRKWEQFPDL